MLYEYVGSWGSQVNVVQEEAAHLAGAGAPQVHTGPQAHTQQVAGRPVHQVQVEVVLQLGGVQHLEGDLGDLTGRLTWGAQELVAVGENQEEMSGRKRWRRRRRRTHQEGGGGEGGGGAGGGGGGGTRRRHQGGGGGGGGGGTTIEHFQHFHV